MSPIQGLSLLLLFAVRPHDVLGSDCEKQYGKDIRVCEESRRDSECTFFMKLRGESCNQFCERQGGTCLYANPNSSEPCKTYGTNDCDAGFFDNICTCSIYSNPPPRPPRPSTICTKKFSDDILICDEQDSHCIFYVELGGTSCREYCRRRGESCAKTRISDGDYTCMNVGETACDEVFDRAICECSLDETDLTPRPTSEPTHQPSPEPTSLPCREKYGRDVLVCDENESECTFYVELQGDSCDEYCEARAGTCLSAKANMGVERTCTSYGTNVCEAKFFDNICTCSMGSDPPPRPPTMPTPCSNKFGEDVLICDEQTEECIFYAELSGLSCREYCGRRGESCVRTRISDGENTCMNVGETSCDDIFDRAICQCTLLQNNPVPTSRPSKDPTRQPTRFPTPNPSKSPTPLPTRPPTPLPTANPTLSPTKAPTVPPTETPSLKPSPRPTSGPTSIPTTAPTKSSTLLPTRATSVPTAKPSAEPTKPPTASPTETPTPPPSPDLTKRPTSFPTSAPTKSPTIQPTVSGPTTPEFDDRLCGKCDRNGCFSSVNPENEQKCLKFDCFNRIDCPEYVSTSDPPNEWEEPPLDPLPPEPGEFEEKRKTGQVCLINEHCESNVCRNFACMASAACYPIKHKKASPFDANKINIVFVGSAFNNHEAFRSKAIEAYNKMKEHKMFAASNENLNVFLVDPVELDPSFCVFNCAGVERLLCCNVVKAQKLSSHCLPEGANLQTIVIHNDSKYGGGGYTSQNLATMSTHPLGSQVVIHELGHSLFELGDEYSYGSGANNDPNCDEAEDCSKWADLIDRTPPEYPPVKCIPGCRNNNFFVSGVTYMNVLNEQVGAVNDRFTCCTYQALTKSMPPYCRAFDFEKDYLLNYCLSNDFQNYGRSNYGNNPKLLITTGMVRKDKSKYVHVSDPMLVDIQLNYKRRGRFAVADPVVGPSGLYRKERVVGNFKRLAQAAAAGFEKAVQVKVTYATKGRERFFFSTNTTIEVPSIAESYSTTGANDDDLQQRSEEAQVINLVLNAQGRRIKNIRAKIVSTGI